MKNIFIIIILTFCPLASLFAQDNYEIFRKEMFLIEKQENEYRKVIWGENDSSQDFKFWCKKKSSLPSTPSERIEMTNDSWKYWIFMYAISYPWMNLKRSWKCFHFRYKKQKLVNVISSLSSMQGSILPANNVLISRWKDMMGKQ